MERECPARQSIAFVDRVAAADIPMLIKDLPKTRTAHPTDSHPPLGARLDALRVNLTDVAESARVVRPADSAALLLTDIDKLDEVLSQAHTELITQDLGIRLQSEAQAQGWRSRESCLQACRRWVCEHRPVSP